MDQSKQAPGQPARGVRIPWRLLAFVALLAAYLLVIQGIVHWSPLLTMDRDVWRWDLRVRYPDWYGWIHTYVMLGQRGPATLTAMPWFVWLAWKYRTARPLLMLGTGLLALNLSVGIVKLAVGRIGPLSTHKVHAVFEGGNIFPSGHTSNTVVLYGVIAMLAVSYRALTAAVAVFIALTVGLSTVYLDTHWLTDVLGGWMAGGLVLLALPTLMPFVERLYAWAERRFGPAVRRRLRRSIGSKPVASPLGPQLARITPELKTGREKTRVPAKL